MFGRPNIIGTSTSQYMASAEGYTASGAYHTVLTSKSLRGNDSAVKGFRIDFDAEGYSGIYGDSETVQPKAVRALVCIKT